MLTAVVNERADLTQVHLDSSLHCHVCAIEATGSPETQPPGQAGNTPQAEPLLEGLRPSHVLTDQTYDIKPLRNFIIAQGDESVIPGRCHHKVIINHDRKLYRKHNIIARDISCIRQFRRLTIRFEKTASSYLGFVMFVAVRRWWLQIPLPLISIRLSIPSRVTNSVARSTPRSPRGAGREASGAPKAHRASRSSRSRHAKMHSMRVAAGLVKISSPHNARLSSSLCFQQPETGRQPGLSALDKPRQPAGLCRARQSQPSAPRPSPLAEKPYVNSHRGLIRSTVAKQLSFRFGAQT